jgi:ATP-dependent DNA ligase
VKEKIHWLEPKLVHEVACAEMTAVKQLRQTTFLGWLDHKTAKEVVLERLMRNSLAHDFDRLIGSATLIGYKITKMLWGVGGS